MYLERRGSSCPVAPWCRVQSGNVSDQDVSKACVECGVRQYSVCHVDALELHQEAELRIDKKYRVRTETEKDQG